MGDIDNEKLIKFFRLMGSSSDGEALTALRMARRHVDSCGLGWTEFVDGLFRHAASSLGSSSSSAWGASAGGSSGGRPGHQSSRAAQDEFEEMFRGFGGFGGYSGSRSQRERNDFFDNLRRAYEQKARERQAEQQRNKFNDGWFKQRAYEDEKARRAANQWASSEANQRRKEAEARQAQFQSMRQNDDEDMILECVRILQYFEKTTAWPKSDIIKEMKKMLNEKHVTEAAKRHWGETIW